MSHQGKKKHLKSKRLGGLGGHEWGCQVRAVFTFKGQTQTLFSEQRCCVLELFKIGNYSCFLSVFLTIAIEQERLFFCQIEFVSTLVWTSLHGNCIARWLRMTKCYQLQKLDLRQHVSQEVSQGTRQDSLPRKLSLYFFLFKDLCVIIIISNCTNSSWIVSLGGGFVFFNFHPENWGRWTHIFQRGWNHQLDPHQASNTDLRASGGLQLKRPASGVETGEEPRFWFQPMEVWEIRGAAFWLQKIRGALRRGLGVLLWNGLKYYEYFYLRHSGLIWFISANRLETIPAATNSETSARMISWRKPLVLHLLTLAVCRKPRNFTPRRLTPQ